MHTLSEWVTVLADQGIGAWMFVGVAVAMVGAVVARLRRKRRRVLTGHSNVTIGPAAFSSITHGDRTVSFGNAIEVEQPATSAPRDGTPPERP